MATPELDLLRGTLDVLVLKALSWGQQHGHAVSAWIRETTADDLQIEDGALYTALHRLERRNLVSSEWGLSEHNRKAKYYQLTEMGRAELRREARRFSRYADAVFKVLRAERFAPAR